MKRVTIYITTKNRPSDFQRSLSSAINQSYKNIEIIVVDDGSNLLNAEKAKAMCSCDNRVIYIHNEVSNGAPAARNLAIKLASGYFVTGLDDDDYFESDRIELFVKKWSSLESKGFSQPVGFLYSQYKIFTSTERYFYSKFPSLATSKMMLKGNCVGNQIFAPLDNWINAGLFSTKMPAWQDLELFYRFCDKIGHGVLVDNPSYVFFDIRSSDRISTKGFHRIKDAYNNFIKLHPKLNNKEKSLLYMQLFSKYYGFNPSLSDLKYLLSLKPPIPTFLRLAFRTLLKY